MALRRWNRFASGVDDAKPGDGIGEDAKPESRMDVIADLGGAEEVDRHHTP
jgi:hypothetical protein